MKTGLFSDWRKWGAFCIPAVGAIVLTLLLLVGSLSKIEETFFVQKVVIWVLGAGIISYGHALAHSTQSNWQGKAFKDLTENAQRIALGVHTVWFILFVIAALAF